MAAMLVTIASGATTILLAFPMMVPRRITTTAAHMIPSAMRSRTNAKVAAAMVSAHGKRRCAVTLLLVTSGLAIPLMAIRSKIYSCDTVQEESTAQSQVMV